MKEITNSTAEFLNKVKEEYNIKETVYFTVDEDEKIDCIFNIYKRDKKDESYKTAFIEQKCIGKTDVDNITYYYICENRKHEKQFSKELRQFKNLYMIYNTTTNRVFKLR